MGHDPGCVAYRMPRGIPLRATCAGTVLGVVVWHKARTSDTGSDGDNCCHNQIHAGDTRQVGLPKAQPARPLLDSVMQHAGQATADSVVW